MSMEWGWKNLILSYEVKDGPKIWVMDTVTALSCTTRTWNKSRNWRRRSKRMQLITSQCLNSSVSGRHSSRKGQTTHAWLRRRARTISTNLCFCTPRYWRCLKTFTRKISWKESCSWSCSSCILNSRSRTGSILWLTCARSSRLSTVTGTSYSRSMSRTARPTRSSVSRRSRVSQPTHPSHCRTCKIIKCWSMNSWAVYRERRTKNTWWRLRKKR